MSSIMEIQHQVRENADELQAFIHELGSWQKEMETKDNQLRRAAGAQSSEHSQNQSKQNIKKNESVKTTKLVEEVPEKKLKSYDYAAWDKFDVEKALEDIDCNEENLESSQDEDENSEEEEALLVQKAFAEKDRGNEFFKKGDYASSIDCYTRGMQMDPSNPILPANRAMALLKQGMAAAAEADCTIALSLDSTYVKAYHRRANARVMLNQLDLASDDFKKVLYYEPNNKLAMSELKKLEEMLKKDPIEKTEEKINKPKTSSFDEGLKGKFSTNKKKEVLDCKSSNEENAYRLFKALEDDKKESENSGPNKLDDVLSEMVFPVTKPPHKRSMKPLCRIHVKDSDANSKIVVPVKGEEQKIQKSSLIEVIKEDSSGSPIASSMKTDKTFITKISSEPEPLVTVDTIKKEKNLNVGTKPPKTSVQFHFVWRHLDNNLNRAKYLQLLKNPSLDYSAIFKQAMESKIFGEILDVLLILDTSIFSKHLLGLSRVPRMSTLIMFLGPEDLGKLKELLKRSTSPNSGLTENEIRQIEKVFFVL